MDEAGGLKWIAGLVLEVLRGRGGDPQAVFEVLYDGDDDPHEADHLYEDYFNSSLHFNRFKG